MFFIYVIGEVLQIFYLIFNSFKIHCIIFSNPYKIIKSMEMMAI